MKPGKLLGAFIVCVCILAAGYSLRGSVRQSLTVKEVMASPGEPCEVYGEVVKNSPKYDMQAARLDFTLQDKLGDTIPVVYNKPKPANFDQASHVKAIGAYRDGAFMADSLLLKCPSKYITGPEAPGKSGSDQNPYATLGKGT
jgi:cytochrome c-type biogenesis protein CcmE